MNPLPTARRSPYKGLIPYAEVDAPFFFGREKDTRLIIANLFASPLTLLYGASGVGKSSVLRAGVAHQLSQREDLLVLVFNTWQNNPVNDLKQTIADWAGLAHHAGWIKVVRPLSKEPSAGLSEFLAACARVLDRRLMIILDQFEEYFLYHPQDEEFADEFPGAVTQTDAPVSFLISIREDFFAKLDRFEGRIPTLYDNYLRVEHLNREAARVAIEKPIAQYNAFYETDGEPFSIEPILVEAVLNQVETGQVSFGEAGRGAVEPSTLPQNAKAQIETPFLQLVMTRLWDEEFATPTRELRLATLTRLGGAEKIVRTHLDEVMATLSTKEQDTAAIIFRYLVTPSGTKIAYSTSDLAVIAEAEPAQVGPVMEKLSGGQVRVLRPLDPAPGRHGEMRYEVFHDVLAPAILDWRARRIQVRVILQSLNQSLDRFNELDRDIAARILPLFIGSSGTRNACTLDQLVFGVGLPIGPVRKVVFQLSSWNIVRSEIRQDTIWFELSHDLFIEPIQHWLKNHRKLTYLGVWSTNLILLYFVGLASFLIYSLIRFWPSGYLRELDAVVPVMFFFREIFISNDERLVILALLSGALGGLLRTLPSLYWYVLNRLLATKWIPYLALLPFFGAGLAAMIYFLLRAGFIDPAIASNVINPFGVAAMAFLIGLFSGQTANKLREVFRSLFTSSSEKLGNSATRAPHR